MANNEPATKADLAELKEEILERISDAETQVLTAFYGFAQSNNKRITEVEVNEMALRSRIATLEDRLLEVEKRLNIPPAA